MGDSGGNSIPKFVETEKDLGVTLSRNLKFSTHIRIQANKATAILGQLKRTFRFWTIATCRTLYCAFVRPHLEYAAAVWSPHSKKDIKILESVQRRATKLVSRYDNWSYADCLAVFGLTTLQERRVRGDMIQLFKFNRGVNEAS
jgi:ribonuclease P/MRP protein subunit RPP40